MNCLRIILVAITIFLISCKETPKTKTQEIPAKQRKLASQLHGQWQAVTYFDIIAETKDHMAAEEKYKFVHQISFDSATLCSDNPKGHWESYEAGDGYLDMVYDTSLKTFKIIADDNYTIEDVRNSKYLTVKSNTGEKYKFIKDSLDYAKLLAKYNKALIAGSYYIKEKPAETVTFGLPDNVSGFAEFSRYKLNIWSEDHGKLFLYDSDDRDYENMAYFKYQCHHDSVNLIYLDKELNETDSSLTLIKHK